VQPAAGTPPHTGRLTQREPPCNIAALIAGVLILVMPKLLNYIIALYLIVTGLIGIFGR
jgi:hypothetical protein